MTIQQIGYFIKLAEELNYTYVARMFFITQPTLSRQIVNLENELGADLFSRKNNTVALTKEGFFFYEKMKPLYKEITDIVRETRTIAQIEDNITIGIQEEQLISDELLDAIKKIREKYPDVKIVIARESMEKLFSGLAKGTYAVVNAMKFPEKGIFDELLGYVRIQTEETYMVISKEIDNNDGMVISREQFKKYLNRYDLLLPEFFTETSINKLKSYLGAVLDLQNDENLRLIESGSALSIPVQVASQLGISITNKTSMFKIDPSVSMMKIEGTENSYEKGIFYSNKTAAPVIRELIRMVKANIKAV